MDLRMLSAWRSWIYAFVLLTVFAVLVWWFIPAVKNAHKEAPVDSQIWVHSNCVDPTAAAPEYGNRETLSYCGNS